MKSVICTVGSIWILWLGLGLGQVALADNCAAYEAELENIFMDETSKIEPKRIEQIWQSCDEPTDKMKLIYHYFKAEAALTYHQRQPSRAYQVANYYFDRAAKYYGLVNNPASNRDILVQTFYVRASRLESRIKQIGLGLGYRTSNQSKLVARGSWSKEIPDVNPALALINPRGGSGRREASFAKTFYYNGSYTDQQPGDRAVIPRSVNASDGDEPYGFVGHLENLAFVDYLSWLEEVESIPGSPYDDAGMWIDALGEDFQGGVNVMRTLMVRTAPGAQASEAYQVGFGEMIARNLSTAPIYRDGRVYVRVRDERGRDGWVPRDLVIPGGRLAIVLDNAIAYTVWHDRKDRNAVLLKPGQMVILADVKTDEKQDWIQIVTEDKARQGWVAGIDKLSIEPEDIFLGREIEIALNIPSPEARYTYLMQIKQLPEYFRSALAPIIDQEIENIRRK